MSKMRIPRKRSVLTGVGYMLYRFGVYKEAGIIQPASVLVSDLLRWTVLGSVTLIVVLAAGSISLCKLKVPTRRVMSRWPKTS